MNIEDDAKWLEWVAKQFESIAGEDKEIDLEEFKAALKVKEASFLRGVGKKVVQGDGHPTCKSSSCPCWALPLDWVKWVDAASMWWPLVCLGYKCGCPQEGIGQAGGIWTLADCGPGQQGGG